MATPQAALARIARRVSEGGHDVPEAEARRRFERSIANLPRYISLTELWRVFDNNGPQPRVAAEGRAGCLTYAGDSQGLAPRLREMIEAMPPCREDDVPSRA